MLLHSARCVLAAALPLVFVACAHGRNPTSYLPVGAGAQFGNRTEDGVVMQLAAPEASVRAALARGMIANGFEVLVDGPEDRVLETRTRAIGGDTTLVVRADVTPEDADGGGVVVVLSGTYGVPSARVRNARVVQRPGERNTLYARLRAVADSTRSSLAAAR